MKPPSKGANNWCNFVTLSVMNRCQNASNKTHGDSQKTKENMNAPFDENGLNANNDRMPIKWRLERHLQKMSYWGPAIMASSVNPNFNFSQTHIPRPGTTTPLLPLPR